MKPGSPILAGGLFWLAFTVVGPGLAIAAPTALFTYDFSESTQGFYRQADDPHLWQWGTPEKGGAGSARGNVWVTELDQDYVLGALSILRSPSMDLFAYPNSSVVLEHYYDIDPDGSCELEDGTALPGTCGDGGFVRLVIDGEAGGIITPDGGYTGQVLFEDQLSAAFSGSSGDWVTSYFDMVGLNEDALSLDFVFVSNGTEQAPGWFIQSVVVYDGDAIPPRVSVPGRPADTSDVVGPYEVEVLATDNREVMGVDLHYSVNAGEFTAEPMELAPSGRWEAAIPGQGTGSDIAYYVTAWDEAGNRTTFPPPTEEGNYLSFRVRLPAPHQLSFVPNPPPSEALYLSLQWQRPVTIGDGAGDSSDPVPVDYQIMHTVLDSAGVAQSDPIVTEDLDGSDKDLNATVTAAGVPMQDQYAVRARYAVVNSEGTSELVPGDLSDPVSTSVYVPHIESVTPSSEYQGVELEVQIIGIYTTFVQNDLILSFGDGIEVEEIIVNNVSNCTAKIKISEDAPKGIYPLTVWFLDYKLTYAPGLEVLATTELPRITDVEPDHIQRQEQKDIKFTGVNTDFNDETLSVEFWSGIEVEKINVISDTEFIATISAARGASTGNRTVRVIAGPRIFEVNFRVDPEPATSTSLCSAGETGGPVQGDYILLVVAWSGLILLRFIRWRGESRHRGVYAVSRLASEFVCSPVPPGRRAGTHWLRFLRFPIRGRTSR